MRLPDIATHAIAALILQAHRILDSLAAACWPEDGAE